MRRLLLFLLALAIGIGFVWWGLYRDTTEAIRLNKADFTGLTMQDALQKVADAAVEGGALLNNFLRAEEGVSGR